MAIAISNATAVEGLDQYLIFDLSLSESLPFGQLLTLELAAEDGTAKGGLKSNFNSSPENNPVDFANQNFEFSLDEGETWLPATDGNGVTFGFGLRNLQVRLEINDDRAAEGFTPETMNLVIKDIVAGSPPETLDLSDIGIGFIEDNDNFRKPIDVIISDTTATELEDDYITWDVGLSSSSGEFIILELETIERTANGGSKEDIDQALKDEFQALKKLLEDGEFKDLKKETKDELEALNNEDEYKAFKKELNQEDKEQLNLLQKELKEELKIIKDEGIDFANNEFEISLDEGRSWELAREGNQLPIPIGLIDIFKVRTVLADDLESESVESVDLSVANVLIGSVDSFSDVGTAEINDNDQNLQPFTLRYEAEDATLVGPVVKSGRGSQGNGYVDYQNLTNDYIEWEVDVPTSGLIDLTWRYAVGNSNSRPLELSVNGVTELNSLNFPSTGGWSTWDFVTESVELNEGINTIRLEATGSSGANFDWLEVSGAVDVGDSGIPISTLPFTDVRIEGDRVFNFDGADGGMSDKDGEDIGFTMADPTSNPGNPSPPLGSVVGYWPEKLDVTNGVLKITTTPGIQFDDNNNQDNALGVGLNVPSRAVNLETTLVDLPTAAGGYAQAGLWFGHAVDGGESSSEDNYIKAVIYSPQPGDYQLQFLMEQNGIVVESGGVDIPDNLNSLDLNLFIDPETRTVTARYALDDGSIQNLGTLTQVPEEWFSFDQAGLNPEIATGSFGGIFATQRRLSSSQVYSFEDFSVTESILEPIGTWREDLPTAPADILDPGSTVIDDKLYLVGGKNASTHVNTVSVYDPGDRFDAGDDVWTTAPNLPGSAVENPAVVSYDGKLYAFGGSTAPFSGAVSNAAVFDPVSSSWSTLSNMPTARGGATAQVVGDEIYVIGGLGADGASVDTVEVFDPLTGNWSSSTDLQTRRDNPGSAVVDGKLYVFGGRTRNADGFEENDALNTIEIYNPQNNSWSFGEPMPTARRTMSVGTLNNRIQVIGGEASVDGNSFDQNEEYNPVTGTWRTLTSIPTPRHGAGFGTIDDVIYVAGGGPSAGSSFTDVTEGFTL